MVSTNKLSFIFFWANGLRLSKDYAPYTNYESISRWNYNARRPGVPCGPDSLHAHKGVQSVIVYVFGKALRERRAVPYTARAGKLFAYFFKVFLLLHSSLIYEKKLMRRTSNIGTSFLGICILKRPGWGRCWAASESARTVLRLRGKQSSNKILISRSMA